jgi:general secretion pathway protein D
VNFVNADVEAVTRAFAAMIDRPIQIDPRVKGTITVYSEQPQSVQAAWLSYQSALRGLGFAVVESGGLLKVVPEADAKLQTGTVSVGAVGARGDQVITQIFQLRYENPNNLVPILRPLISANNTINANPGTSSLVITDYADNLQRIGRIISALDVPAGTEVEVIPLQHAVAADLAPLVQRLADGGGGPGGPQVPGIAAAAGGSTAVIPDSRANALLIRASNPARLATIRATIAKLDRPNNLIGPGGGMWVVHLKNADAVRLATVVRAAFGAFGGSGGAGGTGGTGPGLSSSPTSTPTIGAVGTGGGQGGGGGQSAAATAALSPVGQPSTGGFIQADPATNSLIITAPEPLYKQVRALIDQLDSRRAQVYIESMIVEVTPTDNADFGFQWQGLLGKTGDRFGLVGGTNFSTGATPNIIDTTVAAAAGSPVVGTGLNIGLLRAYNGVVTLAAIARFMQTQTETNVVSTPNLITLDNEEAKIVVGETCLHHRPVHADGRRHHQPVPDDRAQGRRHHAAHPAADRRERLDPDDDLPGAEQRQGRHGGRYHQRRPSTTKRSIEGTVVVDDGQILVLGGLIEDRFDVTRNKVPLLGDLPFVGSLFRSESRSRKRTNLMVFLRPIVMRDAESTNRFSTDRYDQMRTQQQTTQPAPSVVMPINEAPLLPALPQGREPLAPVNPPDPIRPRPAPAAAVEGSPAQPTAP